MTARTLVRPDVPTATAPAGPLAVRRAPGGPVALLLVDNGKPRAAGVLQAIGEGIAQRVAVASIDIHSKPSAAKPIDADVARLLAARHHLVVTGLGD